MLNINSKVIILNIHISCRCPITSGPTKERIEVERVHLEHVVFSEDQASQLKYVFTIILEPYLSISSPWGIQSQVLTKTIPFLSSELESSSINGVGILKVTDNVVVAAEESPVSLLMCIYT